MELPLHFPSPLSLSSSASASSSSSSSSATSTNISTANALLKACDEQSAHSYTNLTTSNAPNHHHLYQCIQVYDEHSISKKRKQLPSSMQEEAHVPTIHRIYSPQRTVDDQLYNCHGVSTIKDDQISCEEEELLGCTTPPHVQSTCNAAYDHDCSIIKESIFHNEELIDADLAKLCAQKSASIGDKQVSNKAGEILLENGDHGIECGCSIIRRGPPPAPRKPKAKPRIHKSDDRLNFFIPPGPDLELFFSSACASTAPAPAPAPTNIYKQENDDA